VDDEPKGKPSGQQQSGPKASTSSGLSQLSWASDPPSIATFDDMVVGAYSIFTPFGSNRATRNTNYSTLTNTLNRPIVFDATVQGNPNTGSRLSTVVNEDLVSEVVMNSLSRIITTPGDISMENIKIAIRQYLGYVCNLVGSWATTAGLYGLAEGFGPGAGQLKNYLAQIGARPWQQEAKASILKSIPMPPNLVQYLMQWYAVKQVPDGRSMFCVPNQPTGLSDGEYRTGVGASGYELKAFEAEYRNLIALADDEGQEVYPEIRRIFMNAGWTLFDFPTSIPVIRDGKWWDNQVVNMPFVTYKYSDNADVFQCNPQAGSSRRLYSLSVYAESNSPDLERLLMPSYSTLEPASYDRGTGAFDGSEFTGPLQCQMVSLGSYKVDGLIIEGPLDDNVIGYAIPSVLSIGQVNGIDQIGWSRTIADAPGDAATSWATSDYIAALYSEMCNMLLTDEGTTELYPTELYEKIFLGQSTTVSSNRLKFSNTVIPNMIGDPTTFADEITGSNADLQRVYEYFLAAKS